MQGKNISKTQLEMTAWVCVCVCGGGAYILMQHKVENWL